MKNTNAHSGLSPENIEIQGKTFNRPYEVPEVGFLQASYELNEADFLRIKNNKSTYSDWSNRFFFGSATSFVLFLVNVIMNQIDSKAQFPIYPELIACGIGLIVGLIIWFIGRNKTSDYTKLIRDIENHFKNHPRLRRTISHED